MGILMSREPDERRMRLIEEKLGINNNHLSNFQRYSIFYDNNKEMMEKFDEVERKLKGRVETMEQQMCNMVRVFEVLTNEGRIKQILDEHKAQNKNPNLY